MQKKLQDKLWYKNAIFYAVIVEFFKDENGDGVGDFSGLTSALDYIKDLGIDCIWLLPFYPSVRRDNGYDIVDYCSVDKQYGDLKDFKYFVKEAKKRDLRVIIDLVVHHTSDQHDWFKKANKDIESKYHDYYIWTKKVPDYKQPKNAFPGIEAGVWRVSPETKEYYFHSFYSFEPDLNITNPKVQEEIEKIMRFWMKTGIDGFRMDAATLMFSKKGLDGTEVKHPEKIMEKWNQLVKSYNPEAILLGEADVKASQVPLYFGKGGRMDLLYSFLLNRYLFLALAEKKGDPIRHYIPKLPIPPFSAQWVNFLRNHDELNLEMLRKAEQEIVFSAFGPDPGMVVYDRGIRRRLAPMLNGDIRRLKMAYTLLFSLPGADMILYGDEIGMGDDLRLPERMGIRMPMQWDKTKNAGFSNADPSAMVRSIIDSGPYRYQKVNVATQEQDKSSLLSHIKQLISLRKSHIAIAHGKYKLLTLQPPQVFGISYEFEGETVIILSNLSEKPCLVSLEDYKNTLLESISGDGLYEKEQEATSISLNGYGYRWFKIKENPETL